MFVFMRYLLKKLVILRQVLRVKLCKLTFCAFINKPGSKTKHVVEQEPKTVLVTLLTNVMQKVERVKVHVLMGSGSAVLVSYIKSLISCQKLFRFMENTPEFLNLKYSQILTQK